MFQVWIDLLRVMAIKLPNIANLESYGTLYSQDPEQDFFSNIIHLQVMLSVWLSVSLLMFDAIVD